MAKRSTTELVAIIDVFHTLSFVTEDQRTMTRTHLNRTCAMLTTLSRRMAASTDS